MYYIRYNVNENVKLYGYLVTKSNQINIIVIHVY
jgi:hypothetical protein